MKVMMVTIWRWHSNLDTRQQIITNVRTKVAQTFAQFQFHGTVRGDFLHTTINKRLSERNELLSVLNFNCTLWVS